MLAAWQRGLRPASWLARSATRRSRTWPAPPAGAGRNLSTDLRVSTDGAGRAARYRRPQVRTASRGGAHVSRQPRALVYAAGLACALAATACTAAGGPGQRASAAATVAGRPVIEVGSFNFPESVTLAYLYADALADRGYPVRVLPDLGPRELVDPALMAGLIQLVPEYTGSALEFVSLGRISATANIVATAAALATAMTGRGLVVGHPAAAQAGNAIAVTAATA